MYQRRYEKLYLMLRQESMGYGLGQRSPWGSCIIEIKNNKGQLRLQVQGLSPLQKSKYTVYALVEKDKQYKGIACGQLAVDVQGCATFVWEFLPDDMGEQCAIEDVFAVAVTSTDKGYLTAPLTAYVGAEKQWLSTVQLPTHTAEKTATIPKKPISEKPILEKSISENTIPEKKVNEEYDIQAAEAVQPLENPFSYHGNFRGLLQKFREEMKELTELGVLTQEEQNRILGITPKQNITFIKQQSEPLEQKQSESAQLEPTQTEQVPLGQVQPEQEVQLEQAQSEQAQSEQAQSEQVQSEQAQSEQVQSEQAQSEQAQSEQVQQKQTQPKQTQSEQTRKRAAALQDRTTSSTPTQNIQQFTALQILSGRETVYPPFGDGQTWKQIQLQDLILFPAVPLQWQKNTFFRLAQAQFGHFLLRREGNEFLLAIPDTYNSDEKAYAQQLGFSTFVPLSNETQKGYWIGKLPSKKDIADVVF